MPDTSKVQVKRVTREIAETDENGKPTGKKVRDPDSVITGFSYLDPEKPDSYTMFVCDENKDTFEMTAAQAAAAVATGGFAVSESSKSKAKEPLNDSE